jgi:hypothetical protein
MASEDSNSAGATERRQVDWIAGRSFRRASWGSPLPFRDPSPPLRRPVRGAIEGALGGRGGDQRPSPRAEHRTRATSGQGSHLPSWPGSPTAPLHADPLRSGGFGCASAGCPHEVDGGGSRATRDALGGHPTTMPPGARARGTARPQRCGLSGSGGGSPSSPRPGTARSPRRTAPPNGVLISAF